MTTLSKFQQSELKRFDKEFNSDETHNAGREKFVIFLKTAIKKAYDLGKEERGKEILAKIKEIKKQWDNEPEVVKIFPPDYSESDDFVNYLIRNLLKNK